MWHIYGIESVRIVKAWNQCFFTHVMCFICVPICLLTWVVLLIFLFCLLLLWLLLLPLRWNETLILFHTHRHTFAWCTNYIQMYHCIDETMTYSAEFEMRNVCSSETHTHLHFRSHTRSYDLTFTLSLYVSSMPLFPNSISFNQPQNIHIANSVSHLSLVSPTSPSTPSIELIIKSVQKYK